jgi:hypothetical protein
VASGRSTVTELLNYKKDGTLFRNAVMMAPILGAEGAILYYLGSQMDVTESVGLPFRLRRQRLREGEEPDPASTPSVGANDPGLSQQADRRDPGYQ